MRLRLAALLVLAVTAWASQAEPAAAQAFCGVFPGHCPPAPAEVPLNPDGSVQVENPHDLEPLPARSDGEPLYPRRDGRLWTGFSDVSVDAGTMSPAELGAITAAMGGSFVRLALYWPGVQPPDAGHAPGRRDDPARWFWSRYDAQYRAFVRAGVRPLWIVLQTPRDFVDVDEARMRCLGAASWYCHGEPARRSSAGLDGLRALERFAAELARRYPLAAGFEYRNEPNLPTTGCRPEPDAPPRVAPRRYAAGLRAFAMGAHAARPAIRVLGGSLSNCHPRRYVLPYLRKLLRSGAAEAADGLTLHPYDEEPGTGERFVALLDRVGRLLRRRGHPDMRLFPDEVGVRAPGRAEEAFQSRRLLVHQYDRLDRPGGDIALGRNHDAFAFFTAIGTDVHTAGYGWLEPRDRLFGHFRARRAFCDARERFRVATPLPPFVRGCPAAGGA